MVVFVVRWLLLLPPLLLLRSAARLPSSMAFRMVVSQQPPTTRLCKEGIGCFEGLEHKQSRKGATRTTALRAVTFRYSSSSFDHLKALDDDDNNNNNKAADGGDTDPAAIAASNRATVGALGSMAVAVAASSAWLPQDYENLSLLLGAASAGAGYVALGGPRARQASKPRDGGYDAKFVVDRPGRLRAILRALSDEDGSPPPRGGSSEERESETAATTGSAVEVLESSSLSDGSGDRISRAMQYIRKVHTPGYVDELEAACADARAIGRARRLHPTVMRTLVDGNSFAAAVESVADWIDAVDEALADPKHQQQHQRPDRGLRFCLSRPPSHHACRSRGSGGCLLNGPAIAAVRALERGAGSVSILDIDAHHGNGIAHCVQDNASIRYCSVHEEVAEKNWFRSRADIEQRERGPDPRRPDRDDTGPLGNIRNIPLPRGTTWDTGYERALEEEAIPFLTEGSPDLLVLAAGFDALAVDSSSGLALQPGDYRSIGELLKSAFGDRVVAGLEGGYAWRDGTLGTAVLELVQPWIREAGGSSSSSSTGNNNNSNNKNASNESFSVGTEPRNGSS